MSTDTIEYKGYKIKIAQDQDAENPFESWDCEPPLLTYYGGGHSSAKAYNDAPESWYDILRLLPNAIWKRGQRMAFLREFILCYGETLRNYVEQVCRVGDLEACAEILVDKLGAKPEGWGSACTWFETAESILKYAGISCLYEQSNGHCQGDSTLCLVVLTPDWVQTVGVAPEQGDSTLCLVVLTPDWVQTVGVAPEHFESCCESAIELYSAWAWGDVYGISEIIAPGSLDEDGDETEGEAMEEGSVWGFYGRDHEKSGLMESARDTIDWHIEKQAKEVSDILAMVSAD